METVRKSFLTSKMLKNAMIDALKKFSPTYMLKNPVMFVVEVGFLFVLLLVLFPNMFGMRMENKHADYIMALLLPYFL